METVIVDTGPLVAYLCRDDQDHDWTEDQFRRFQSPLITCDAVVSEAMFLLGRLQDGVRPLLGLLERSVVVPSFNLSVELKPVCQLIRRYENMPMSLADACLVRLAELHARSQVFTLDADFRIYRRHGNKVIPVLMPGD